MCYLLRLGFYSELEISTQHSLRKPVQPQL